MNCKDCGEQMEGNGYNTVLHCPNVDVSDITPDCDPVYCETDDELSEFEEEYNNMLPDWATGENNYINYMSKLGLVSSPIEQWNLWQAVWLNMKC